MGPKFYSPKLFLLSKKMHSLILYSRVKFSRVESHTLKISHLYVLLSLTFAQRLSAGGVSLARPSLECAGSPQSASMGGLILCLTTETYKTQTKVKHTHIFKSN